MSTMRKLAICFLLSCILLTMQKTATAGTASAAGMRSHEGEGAERVAGSAARGGWRLAASPSPYLQAHAGDPVAWRRWGPAVLEEARRLKRPIFLSIGYLACYWCHVQQREVFTEPRLARFINRHFLPVLVDREVHPDLDAYFQEAGRLLEGRGGWPMNVFLTPAGKPFVAFGYLPPGRFRRIMERVAADWRRSPAALRETGKRLDALIRQRLWEGAPRLATRTVENTDLARTDTDDLTQLAKEAAALFDPFHGGLAAGPKHYRQPLLAFLLRMAENHRIREAQEVVRTTLNAIMRGGVRDHLAGGFFRYATDPLWAMPHYEKMLADQALLSILLLEAWRAFGVDAYRDVARETLDYVLSDLRGADGLFFSSRDALGVGGEGGYYLFSPVALRRILGAADAALVTRVSGVVPRGEAAGMILPSLIGAETALETRAARRLFARLAVARRRRTPPARDEKIVTAWNGMMIEALAISAMATSNGGHARAARRAARRVLVAMRDRRGRLMRIRHAGRVATPAMLDDYAWLILGLLALHDLDGEGGGKWLDQATRLGRDMLRRFRLADGRFALTAADTSGFRLAVWRDDAAPAAQAVALRALTRLSRRSGEADFARAAKALAHALAPGAVGDVVFGAGSLLAIDELLRGESGAVQYAGGGVVRAMVRSAGGPARNRRFELVLDIRRGWHVNADPAGETWLIPTTVALVDDQGRVPARIDWPAPVMRRLARSGRPLPLYEGKVTAVMRLSRRSHAPLVVRLHVQPCSRKTCLSPEVLSLHPWPSFTPNVP